MKKKKLYIFNGTSRAATYGIGTYINELANSLKNTDIDFTVVHLYAEGNEVQQVEKDGYKQIQIPADNNPAKARGSQRYYSKTVSYLLREIIPEEKEIEYIFQLNFMTNSSLVVSLKKMFACKVILVAHYTNWSFSLLGDTKKLQSIMNKKSLRLKGPLEKQIYKGLKEDEKMIAKCDCFVCVAQHTLTSLGKVIRIDKSKCYVVSNALTDTYKQFSDEKKNNLREKYHIDPDEWILLYAGRLDEVKGVKFLINAFKKIFDSYSSIRLIIVGDGAFQQLLTDSKHYWTKVSFTGRLNKKELYDLYQIANVGIIPSLHEEFGLIAIEMMMHELPIIVSDTGGLSEIVEDAVSGLKVPVRVKKGKRIVDEKLLAEKISALLDDPVYARNIGEAGRQVFLQKYELSIFKEKMLHLYQTI
ncbi:TIGR04157 family glycosyltransferase [Parabacteroides sp. Marseille-P3160]|uniref:TIGR04157 family glycosyltransferase n=1 Tax=Parabacteroides sp. Marseille-P3160 TaxID=1917887 RepID=UPI0009BB495A|nr:TIGR04157 family glycosyltransferase [Parabacteroides sp. Marseille-P3160]